MPYWQYKKLENVETSASFNERGPRISLVTTSEGAQNQANHTTGITPMVEKNISFSHPSNISALTTSDNGKSFSEAVAEGKVKTPDSTGSLIGKGGVKRSASPFPIDKKKRTKSGEEEKTSKVFQESNDWE